MKIEKIDTDQTHNSSYHDRPTSSDPSQEELSKLRWEISRLQSLERGLVVKKSNKSFAVQSDGVVEARQARRDTRTRKGLAIVVGLGLLTWFAMTVLAVVKQMKGARNNLRFVGKFGVNSPVTFQEVFQMQGVPQANENASPPAEGEFQVLAISREERDLYSTRSYRTGPHEVNASAKLSRELERSKDCPSLTHR
jgi:hypothetical protein